MALYPGATGRPMQFRERQVHMLLLPTGYECIGGAHACIHNRLEFSSVASNPEIIESLWVVMSGLITLIIQQERVGEVLDDVAGLFPH